jgi:hypothetical protein
MTSFPKIRACVKAENSLFRQWAYLRRFRPLSGGLSTTRKEFRMLKLPPALRPRREKVFGPGPAIRLDGNAKARLWAFAQGWTAKHRAARQHRGPITRAFMEILKTMLWGFHNNETGRCFPSYETIAARARCNRDTVYEAIKVFEHADILTWVNRITRIKVQELVLKIERFQPEDMNIRMSGGKPSYSHVVTVSGSGKIVYTAGQLARDANRNCVGKGDMRRALGCSQ